MISKSVSVVIILFSDLYVVVQFYPWFKFSFLLFLGMVMYMIMILKQKNIEFDARMKLNHNIYTPGCLLIKSTIYFFLSDLFNL